MFVGDPAHPALAHVSFLWRDKAPAAHWFHSVSTWSHYQTHFTLRQRKVFRHLGRKLEIGGYKYTQCKILISDSAKLKSDSLVHALNYQSKRFRLPNKTVTVISALKLKPVSGIWLFSHEELALSTWCRFSCCLFVRLKFTAPVSQRQHTIILCEMKSCPRSSTSTFAYTK